ncbi:hypothetical protein WP50_28775, partial [Lactiplantibacillus plantarum]
MTTAGAVTAFEKINLQAELHAQTQLPVIIENDANAAAIAEQWLGVAQNVPNYLSLVLGTGVGGALVINNQIYRGAHARSGECGWMVVDDDEIDTENADRHNGWPSNRTSRAACSVNLIVHANH